MSRPDFAPLVPSNRYFSVFCAFMWPKYPGQAGGEIRDFHLLRQLLRTSQVVFVALTNDPADSRSDPLMEHLHSFYFPPHPKRWNVFKALSLKLEMLLGRGHRWLSRHQIPIVGPRYHNDISIFAPWVERDIVPIVRESIQKHSPDFLFVSPQINPLALRLKEISASTRFILDAFDVEAVRIERLENTFSGIGRVAARLESRRAYRYERDNLAYYDGIIAVSDTDRQIFISKYGFEPDRILTVPNSVDTNYFYFRSQPPSGPKRVIFVAHMAYRPNEDAAQRLLKEIMPRVRKAIPDAQAWIVGQGASRDLLALHDGRNNFITGRVADVRPYLQQSTVACIPLRAGSGTKYKVLEALSSGVPAVCSSIAVEGLDLYPGEHYLPAETDEEFAKEIVQVLQRPEEFSHIAHQGRLYVETHYSWDNTLKRLDGWLEHIKQLPKRV